MAIFWIWSRFTWYATYYDNQDVVFRISYLLIVFPILGIVNNVDAILNQDYRMATYWYIALEVVLLFLWGRVLFRTHRFRANSQSFFVSYSIGLALVVLSLFVPANAQYVCWGLAILSEMIGPVIGWHRCRGKLPVHTSHIIERHGLFTIILLGEGVVSVSSNFTQVTDLGAGLTLALAYLLVVALWWIYFDYGFGFATKLSKNPTNTFVFGYGQFLVFAAIALSTISLEYGLHRALAQSQLPSEEHFSWAALLPISSGTFLLSLGFVQWLVSEENPRNIYALRFVIGVGLVVLPWVIALSFSASLLVSTLPLTLVGGNDTYWWGRGKRSERKRKPSSHCF